MQPRNPAIREGLMFGGGLAVLFIINFFLAYIAGIGLGGLITLVAALAAYLVAGMRAAQTTGRVQSGVIAGLVTGLFSSVVDAVVVMVLSFIFIDKVRASYEASAKALGAATTHYTNSMVITSQIFSVLLGIVIASAVGLGLGALGGNIGKGRAPLPQQTYQESYYQGIPTPPPPPTQQP
jgi:hypothetical protein